MRSSAIWGKDPVLLIVSLLRVHGWRWLQWLSAKLGVNPAPILSNSRDHCSFILLFAFSRMSYSK